jgi:hypothetical protein
MPAKHRFVDPREPHRREKKDRSVTAIFHVRKVREKGLRRIPIDQEHHEEEDTGDEKKKTDKERKGFEQLRTEKDEQHGLDEDQEEKDKDKGSGRADEMGNEVNPEHAQAVGDPSRQDKGHDEERQGRDRRRIKEDENEHGRGLCVKDRCGPDREDHQVGIISLIEKKDVPFQDRGKRQEDHEKSKEMAFFDPGLTLVLDEHIFKKKRIRYEPAKGGYHGQQDDDFLLHLLFESKDVVLEQAIEKMPGQDWERLVFEFCCERPNGDHIPPSPPFGKGRGAIIRLNEFPDMAFISTSSPR